MNDISLLSGNANPELAKKIAECLQMNLTDVLCDKFSEGEIRVQIKENIRGKDVFIIQPTCPPTNDNLMELLILIDAVRRASGQRITAVIPYYGYARQDRKDQPRVPISAKLVANMILTAGAHRVLTMDLHASQIQGFFDMPVDHLYAKNVLCEYILSKGVDPKKIVIVSPDVGSLKMARAYADAVGASFAVIDKRRVSPEATEVMHILGSVRGKSAILVDDIVATAGSLVNAAEGLMEKGVTDVYAVISHGLLSGKAIEKVKGCSIIKELVITDTIPFTKQKQCSKVKVVSVASLFAEAIYRIHNEESISCLFYDIRV